MKYRESLVVLAILMASCSSSEQPRQQRALETGRSRTTASTHYQQDASGRPGVRDSKMSTMSARVEAIDQDTRRITLRGPYGNQVTFKAGDQVRNLHQIHVGDQVVADYYESLAIQVVKPGTSGSERETIVDSAAPGEKPEGVMTERSTLTATIEHIDRSAPSITLRDQQGNVHTVRVRRPERLDLVKVGETLKITYEQAVAVSVEPAPPAAK